MIEINLLPGKKKTVKGAGMKLSMPDFKALFAQVKDPWLSAAATPLRWASTSSSGMFQAPPCTASAIGTGNASPRGSA